MNLESYHGTGALNLTRFQTWDALLLDLVERPSTMVVVAARRRGLGHGGWSSNNPHLAKDDAQRFVEFEIDIEPVSLVSRMVSVRQQIAQEWVADLDTLLAVNDLILESYHETQNQKRREEVPTTTTSTTDAMTTPDSSGSGDADADADGFNIENLSGPSSASSAKEEVVTPHHPFERPRPRGRQAYESMANVFLNNKMMEHESRTGLPSSPYRRGSFDLLSLLATQEAVHVVLRNYLEQGDGRRVSLDWLRQFYQERLESHFDGDGPYGRSDDFLQDLLLSLPTATTTSTTTTSRSSQQRNVLELVDPLRIAEDVIHARSQVARQWKDIMQTVVPSDHMQLQKSILAVRMNAVSTTSSPPTTAPTATVHLSSDPSITTTPPTTTAIGEFE